MGWGRGGSKLTSNIFRSELPDNYKKQRETYDNAALCHAWASGNVLRGRSNNMFFENGIIYSFGHHYKAAKIYDVANGFKLVLMNSDTYSPTTSGHLGDIRTATSHLNKISVPDVDPCDDHSANIEYLESKIYNCVEGIFSMVGWHGNGESFLTYVKDLNAYLYAFKLKGVIDIESEDIQITVEALNESYNAKEAKATARRIKKDAREKDLCRGAQVELNRTYGIVVQEFLDDKMSLSDLRKVQGKSVVVGKVFGRDIRRYLNGEVPSDLSEAYEAKIALINADKIQAWRDGHVNYLDYSIRGQYALLRIKGNTVETSLSASVPLDHALRLLTLIQTKRARKGERVGHYTLESVDSLDDVPPVVTIGCHKILLSEALTVLSPYMEVK